MTKPSNARNALAIVAACLAAGACASSEPRAGKLAVVAVAGVSTCDVARDRAAILSMAGEYNVQFSFEETVALHPGYERKKPYRVAASELVVVVESSERRVVLQHILAVNDDGQQEAIKHWRQDWTFEDQTVLEYRGREHWLKRALAPDEARCGWTQAVFEINDGPRYEGWGRFVHANETASWSSNETWRPLPRRERARADYDVIVGVNRHTMSASGWAHEQDNTKVVLRGPSRALVREHGVNLYTRSKAKDLGGARAFWQKHEGFWRDVRTAWSRVIDARTSLTFRKSSGATSLYGDLTDLEGSPSPGDRVARTEEILARHLEAPLAGR